MKVRLFLIKFDFNIWPCSFSEWMLVHTHTHTHTQTFHRLCNTGICALYIWHKLPKNQILYARHQIYIQKSRSKLHEQVSTYDPAIIMMSVGIKRLNVVTAINEYFSWDFHLVTTNNTVLYQVIITLRVVICVLLGSAKYFHIFV